MNRSRDISKKSLIDFIKIQSETLNEKEILTVAIGNEKTTYTLQRLFDQAEKRATAIRAITKPGDRILLVMPTCPEFLELFFACQIAECIPVPVPLEGLKRSIHRLTAIISDCNPSLVVFRKNDELDKALSETQGLFQSTIIKSTEDLIGEASKKSSIIDPSKIAFIQYTSGSTGSPKGVVLTHRNLVANIQMIQKAMRVKSTDRTVSWLPVHHDMGLIGNILASIGTGAFTYVFPAQEFAANPLKWLETIHREKGTITGAPNFAYAAINRKLENQTVDYDLSSVRLIYSGSERISVKTITHFFDRLKKNGLSSKAFFPCYGLAEASLFVSGSLVDANDIPQIKSENNEYPMSGATAELLEVRLTDQPVGEVEIRGDSVSQGYWVNLKKIIQNGQLAEIPNEWVKTGDVGYLVNNNLYITGRIKDLIKINGRNYYPEDLEFEVEKLTEWFSINSIVATSYYDKESGRDLVILIAEILRTKRSGPFDNLFKICLKNVAEVHGVHIDRMIIINPGTMPKTTSGKKQRSKTLEQVLNQQIPINWDSSAASTQQRPNNPEEESFRVLHENIIKISQQINFTLANERKTFPADLIHNLHQAKTLALLIPKEFGGGGLTHRQFYLTGKLLGEIDISLANLLGNHNTIGVLPILNGKVLVQRREVLEDISKNGSICSFALTEPGAGSNPRAISTSLKRSEKGLLLRGEKIWIGNAQFAKYITVIAREFDEQDKEIGISAVLVCRDRHEYQVGPEMLTLGVGPLPQNRLFFNDTILTENDRLSPAGQGMALAFSVMEYARFGLGSVVLGAMDAAVEIATQYADERVVWTGKLSENLYFRRSLAEIQIKRQALGALVDKIAQQLDNGEGLPLHLSLACKISAGEWGFQSADQCLQFCGGRGYTESFGLARIFRDSRIVRIFEGPTEALAYQLGAIILRQPQLLNEYCTTQATPFKTEVNELVDFLVQLAANKNVQEGSQYFYVEIGKMTGYLLSFILLGSKEEAQHAALISMMSKLALDVKFLIQSNTLETTKSSDSITSTHHLGSGTSFYDHWDGYNKTLSTHLALLQTQPLQRKKVLHPAIEDHSALTQVAANQPAINQPAASPSTTALPVAPREEDIQKLKQWLQKISRRNDIDTSRSIAEYGVDSLVMFEFLSFLEEEFKIKVSESMISQKPSIQEIATLIACSQTEAKTKVTA